VSGKTTVRRFTEVPQLRTGEPRIFGTCFGFASDIAYSRDGRLIASAHALGESSVRLWDTRTGAELRKLEGHVGDVNTVAVSPDGKLIASGGDDGTVRLVDLRTGQLVRQLGVAGNYVLGVAFACDGQELIFGGRDGAVRVWAVGSGRLLRTLTGPRSAIVRVAVASNNRLLACGTHSGEVWIWDYQSGTEVSRDSANKTGCYSIAFSPDGTRVAAGNIDGTIRVWSVGSAAPTIQRNVRPHSIVWRERVFGIRNPYAFVNTPGVAFSPDGRWLATGGGNNSADADGIPVQIWEVTTGQRIGSIPNMLGPAMDLKFSPDGCSLAAGGYALRIIPVPGVGRSESAGFGPAATVTTNGQPEPSGRAKRTTAAQLLSEAKAMALANRHTDVRDRLLQAVVLDPTSQEAWYVLAESHLHLGELDQVESALAKARELGLPDGPCCRVLGQVCELRGTTDLAIALYLRAVAEDPVGFDICNNLGKLLNDTGQHRDAIHYLEQSIRSNPNYALAWLNLGVAYGSMERHEEALAHFTRSVALDPNEPLGWVNTGRALATMGRPDEANTALSRAEELASQDPTIAEMVFTIRLQFQVWSPHQGR
jgi:Flp pilus assembly protein TadD